MRTSFFSRFVNYEHRVADALATVAGFAVFLMMMVTVINVFLIFTRLGAVDMAVELVEMLMIVVMFGSFAYADVLDKHVRATMLVDRFSPRLKSLCNVFGYSLSLGICLILTWQLYEYAYRATAIHKTCLSSQLPYYPFTWFALAGFAVFDLRYATRLLESLGTWRKGGQA